MTPHETLDLVRIVAIAHDTEMPDGMAEIWHACCGHLPYGLARAAVIELLQSSPYRPKPAEILERARLIDAQHKREANKARQLVEREQLSIAGAAIAVRARAGADMVRHVLGRLADAGQDVAAGKALGTERATAVADVAVKEWLERTAA